MRDVTRYFAPFEGTRDPQPLAIVRVAFFLGMLLHFAPSLIWIEVGYGRGAVRTDVWNHWLFSHHLPAAGVRILSIVTLLALVAAIVNIAPRISAAVAMVGCYVFASWNSIHLQTLALVPAWAIGILWIICAPKKGDRIASLLPSLILFQVLLAVEFSGIEKLLAGWPMSNEMGIVLAYPHGFLVRDWASGLFVPVAGFFTWATLAIELCTPILILIRRTRVPALIAYELFFLGIIAMLEVPPLFYFIFASAPLLALDDAQWASARRWVRRSVLRRRASPERP